MKFRLNQTVRIKATGARAVVKLIVGGRYLLVVGGVAHVWKDEDELERRTEGQRREWRWPVCVLRR